jgi:hypothetical protein
VRRLFWVFHLVPLQRAALLAPAIISALGKPDLTGRISNALTSRDQHLNLVQPCITSPPLVLEGET